jgi:excisionase family DNA binding protein
MNGVRVDIFFPKEVTSTSFPCILQRSSGSTLTLIGQDTPILRAKLVEFLLANPTIDFVVTPCFVGRLTGCDNPHEVIRQAFGGVSPSPLSYNVKDAAKRLGISYSYIRELIDHGAIKKVKGRVSLAEIERYLEERRIKRGKSLGSLPATLGL